MVQRLASSPFVMMVVVVDDVTNVHQLRLAGEQWEAWGLSSLAGIPKRRLCGGDVEVLAHQSLADLDVAALARRVKPSSARLITRIHRSTISLSSTRLRPK